MKKSFKFLTAVLIMAALTFSAFSAFAESPAGVVYDGTEVFVPVSGITVETASGTVVAGKKADDAFYKSTKLSSGNPHLHQRVYAPNDFYISFDFYLKNRADDNITVRMQPYTIETASDGRYKTTNFDLALTSKNGLTLPDITALPESYRKMAIIPSEKVTMNEWHSLSINLCCLDSKMDIYFDGEKYEVPLSSEWTVASGTETYKFSYMRSGVNNMYIILYSTAEKNAVDFDNISIVTGYAGGKADALNSAYEDENQPGGHYGHLTNVETDAITKKPSIASYNGETVTSDIISIKPDETAEGVISKTIVSEGSGSVRLYSDDTYANELTGDAVVNAGAVMIVPAVNSSGAERIYKTYTIQEMNLFSYEEIAGKDAIKITGFSDKLTAEDIASFNGKKLVLPDKIDGKSVTHIGDYAFYKPATEEAEEVCYGDIDFEIPATAGNIGLYAFKKSGITSLQLGTANVLAYCQYEAFGDCDKLKNITFGANFVGGRGDMFKGCDAIEAVDMSAMKQAIWNPVLEGMFRNCTSLKEIKVGILDTDDTFIPKNFVAGCTSLEKITYNTTFVTSKIVAAAYDGNGMLTSLATAQKEGDTSFESITLPQGNKVVLMQFESLENLKPIVSAMIIK